MLIASVQKYNEVLYVDLLSCNLAKHVFISSDSFSVGFLGFFYS